MEKSNGDKCDYCFKVMDNGLRVLLVSDPDTENGACCMTVDVGGFYNPRDTPGLAHFLEHMLFMGSGKYPDENHYDQIIARNGGSYNGWTSATSTQYYFKVNVDKFEQVLDVFSRFFIDPLFLDSSIGKEVNAVDAEFSRTVNDDSHRAHSVMEALIDSNYPMTRFNIGNKGTLDRVGIREAMISFYNKHYSADRMNLVMVSRDSIDRMVELADKFSDVARRDVRDRVIVGLPYDGFIGGVEEGKVPFVEMVANKKKDYLVMNWQVYGHFGHDSKAYRFWSHIVGHEGKGSLLSHFKKSDLATNLYAGDTDYKHFRLFSVQIELTDRGCSDVLRVISDVYGYFSMLSGMSRSEKRRIYTELQLLSRINFENKSKEDVAEYAIGLSSRLHIYDKEHLLSGEYYMVDFSDSVCKELDSYFGCLVGQKPIIMHRSQKFAGRFVVEPYYGTEYRVGSIVPNRGSGKEFHVPLPNDYIPVDFSMIGFKDGKVKRLVGENNNGSGELWFQTVCSFKVPKVVLEYMIVLPMCCEHDTLQIQIQNRTLMKLYVNMFNEYMNEDFYVAHDLFSIAVNARSYGVSLWVSGYSDKALVLWKAIMDNLFQFPLTNDLFSLILNRMKKSYGDYESINTHDQIMHEIGMLTDDSRYHYKDILKYLSLLTVEDIIRFQKSVFLKHYTIGIVSGNCDETYAIDSYKILNSRFAKCEWFDVNVYCPLKEPNYGLVSKEPYNDKEVDVNSSYLLYYNLGERTDFKSDVLIKLMTNIISEKYFTELRTNQQVGYSVHAFGSSSRYFGKSRKYFMFCIQSPTYDGAELHEKTMKFIDGLEFTEQEFLEARDSYVKNLLEPFQSADEVHANISTAVENRTFVFDEPEQKAALCKSLKYDDFIRGFNEFIVDNKEVLQVRVN